MSSLHPGKCENSSEEYTAASLLFGKGDCSSLRKRNFEGRGNQVGGRGARRCRGHTFR